MPGPLQALNKCLLNECMKHCLKTEKLLQIVYNVFLKESHHSIDVYIKLRFLLKFL